MNRIIEIFKNWEFNKIPRNIKEIKGFKTISQKCKKKENIQRIIKIEENLIYLNKFKGN